MHSPAAALAWEFWWRHRWSLSAFGLFIAVYATVTATARLADPEKYATLGSIWFAMGLCNLIAVFARGAEVRVETADSGFPPRAFVLPVRTAVLVGWPMLQGAGAAVLAWVAWDRLVLRPCGVETPFWWTPMLAAVVVTTQAVLWVPFGLPWVRVPVAIAVLIVLVKASVFLPLIDARLADPDTENTVLSLVAAAVIPTAFLLARAGVACARRGDSPDWVRHVRLPRRSERPWRERPPFASALRAQVWYEWRLRGAGFPLLVLFTLAVLMACGVLLEPDDDTRTRFGVTFLLIPIMFAGFFGSYTGATGDTLRSPFVLPAFAATRPMSNSMIVAAKLWAAGLTAAAAWALAVALTAGWFAYTGGVHDLPRVWEQVVAQIGQARTVGLGVLLAVGPVLLIWRLLVGDQWVGLTGRAWVSHALVIGMSTAMVFGAHEWSEWKGDPARSGRLTDALPWAAGVAVTVKLLAAGWLLWVLVRRGEMGTGTAGRLLGVWLLTAAGLFALLVWLVPSGFAPVYGLALGVVLFLPLARLTAAPLALAWNRHR